MVVALLVTRLATKHPGETLSSHDYLCNISDDQYRRHVIPVKRGRVVKGTSVNSKLPPVKESFFTKESAGLQATKEFQASLSSTSKQSKFQEEGRDVSIDRHSQSSRGLTKEQSAKPLARPPRPR